MTEYSVLMSETGRFSFLCNLGPEEFAEAVADGKVVKGRIYHDIDSVDTQEKYVNGSHVESFEVLNDGE